MSRRLPGTVLDPNTSISISSIAVDGATIQTDANSGAITFIPKPTVATPNPVAVVVSPSGGITSVATTGGVANANAITAAATSNTAAPVTIDITTTAPSNGQALIWNSATSKFIPGSVAAGGGDSTSPKVKSLIYPGNDTAANTVGGQTLYITGSGFAANAQVLVNSAAVPSQSFISASNISFTTPALSTGTYPVYVINPEDGATAILYPGLLVSGEPTWVTSAGSLSASQDASSAWSYSLSATGDTPITYALAAGSSLPTGVSLAANGLVSGTISSPPVTETTYTFSVVATDAQNQDSTRQFTVTATTGEGVLFANNVLLIHADGTNNGNNHAFVDSSNNNFTITRNGNSTQGTFSPFSQTGWSAYFDGTGDYLSTSSAVTLASNFTIECWVNLSSAQANYRMLCGQSISSTGVYFSINSTGLEAQFGNNSGTTASCSHTFTVGTWYHIALVRSGGTVSIYIDGVSKSVTNSSQSASFVVQYVGVGYSTSYPIHGFISNFRIVSSAVYSTGFTPSAAPLTAVANTSLLTCQSNRFVDNSTNAFTITPAGDAKIVAFSPFAPSTAYSTSAVGGSAYFDGSSDRLTLPSSGNLAFGTGDFCVEAWAYFNANPASMMIFTNIADSETQFAFRIDASGYPKVQSWFTNYAISSATVVANQWYHLVACRVSNTLSIFINGTRRATATVTNNFSSTNAFTIGGPSSDFSGYMSGLRVTKGTSPYDPSQTTITVPTAPPTAIANTQLLLNFTNAQIFDQTAKNVLETVGDAKVTTAQYKYGTGSIAFDGTGDYLTIAANPLLALGTADFTVEFWFRGTDGDGNLIGITTNASGNWNLVLASSSLYWQSQYATTNLYNRSATGILDGNWHHIAITRASGTSRMFFDGVLQGATVSDSTSYVAAHALQIGSSGVYGDIAANMDDIRITRGYARYTSNFTPPTAAFQNK